MPPTSVLPLSSPLLILWPIHSSFLISNSTFLPRLPTQNPELRTFSLSLVFQLTTIGPYLTGSQWVDN